jgi:hypothetical protein
MRSRLRILLNAALVVSLLLLRCMARGGIVGAELLGG